METEQEKLKEVHENLKKEYDQITKQIKQYEAFQKFYQELQKARKAYREDDSIAKYHTDGGVDGKESTDKEQVFEEIQKKLSENIENIKLFSETIVEQGTKIDDIEELYKKTLDEIKKKGTKETSSNPTEAIEQLNKEREEKEKLSRENLYLKEQLEALRKKADEDKITAQEAAKKAEQEKIDAEKAAKKADEEKKAAQEAAKKAEQEKMDAENLANKAEQEKM